MSRIALRYTHAMRARSLDVAQHEAAHVVVGLALGMRLELATLTPERVRGQLWHGSVTWREGRESARDAIMYAAGLAWDRSVRLSRGERSSWDWTYCRDIVRSVTAVEACITAAAAILGGRMGAHARVTRALLERDLRAADVRRLARGE